MEKITLNEAKRLLFNGKEILVKYKDSNNLLIIDYDKKTNKVWDKYGLKSLSINDLGNKGEIFYHDIPTIAEYIKYFYGIDFTIKENKKMIDFIEKQLGVKLDFTHLVSQTEWDK